VDQYQAASGDSSFSAAIACDLPGVEGPAIIAYDAAGNELQILTRRADGTYRSRNEIDVGTVSAKKILAGNFGGGSPLTLMLCGGDRALAVPVAARTDLLRKVASFDTELKGVEYGALTAGDVNGDGLAELLVADQGKQHLEVIAFDEEGQMVPATRFKVFESPRGAEQRSYGRDSTPAEPRAIAVGDVTADGKNDLVLLVHDRLIVYPQE